MFNVAFFVIVLLAGFMNVSAMSIKRSEKSENNLEKVEDTEYPIKVNYDVYPVSYRCSHAVRRAQGENFSCNRSEFSSRFAASRDVLSFKASGKFVSKNINQGILDVAVLSFKVYA